MSLMPRTPTMAGPPTMGNTGAVWGSSSGAGANLKRRRRFTEIMQKLSQPEQTQVINGIAIRQPAWSGLAKGLAGAVGAFSQNKLDDLEARQEEARASTMARAIEAITGGDKKTAATILAQDPTTQEKALDIASGIGGGYFSGDSIDAQMANELAKAGYNTADIARMHYTKTVTLPNGRVVAISPEDLGAVRRPDVGYPTINQGDMNNPPPILPAPDIQAIIDNVPTEAVSNTDPGKKAPAPTPPNPNSSGPRVLIQPELSQNQPAAIVLANEYGKALKAGDTERANQILMFAKAVDKGVGVTPDGKFETMPGVLDAAEERKKAEAKGQEIGKELGAAGATLMDLEANMPKLEALVGQLGELSEKATYTYAGKAMNEAARQLGMEVPEGAVARAEYQSLIDNNILPMLRLTFGAQFTQKEGESLRATLGDVNVSPAEKQAVLRSFISQKRNQVEALRRQTAQALPQPIDEQIQTNSPMAGPPVIEQIQTNSPMAGPPVIEGSIAVNPQTGQRIIMRNGNWEILQ